MLRWMRNSIMDTPLEPLARRLYLRLDRSIEGLCEKDTLLVMAHSLERHSNCVDIGAHRGSILGEITARAPLGKHYAFEPVPRHYQYLKKHFPRVNVYPYALSHSPGERQFVHVIDRPTRSGFLNPPEPSRHTEIIRVPVEALDNVIPADTHIHFIKVDVEGAEYEVLQGALQTIRRCRPLIMLEYSLATGAPFGVSIAQMWAILTTECRSSIWLPKAWLSGQPALSAQEFHSAVENGLSYYFVIAPPPPIV